MASAMTSNAVSAVQSSSISSISHLNNINNINNVANNFKSNLDNYLQYQKGNSLLNNRYSFISNLQTGSFGKVTCALDTLTNTHVAIKAMKKSINGVSIMANHEILIMKKLGYHKNITQLLDHFETKKYFIMVLEFADSGDLYDAIHNKTNLGLNIQSNHLAFINFINQLIEVINYSHSKGIYHRDIKPENILLMNDGTIKLCDWGLSTKYIKSTDFNVGTEKYMAPEALIKSNDSDYYYSDKLDAYSIGITLLFVLFNKCPFRKAVNSDPNYSNFLKSKYFIYDFFPNINFTSYTAIVDMLIINRDLNALNYLVENGINNGFTLDQEHLIHFSNNQNNYINSIVDSLNNNNNNENNENLNIENNSHNENDVFLFDDYEHHLNNENINNIDNIDNNNFDDQFMFNNKDEFNHINNHVDHSNVNPISIPLQYQISSTNSIINTTNNNNTNNNNSAMESYCTTYNPSSLFDNNSTVENTNSFINSFELSNTDVWADQISDLRFKFQ